MGGKIFLAGGGGRQESVHVDEAFAAELDRRRPLVYIPVAMTNRPYASCLAWLQSVFVVHGIHEIVMWTGAGQSPLPLTEAAGVYIGGGDTVHLQTWLRRTRAVAALSGALQAGVPVYGGSAGAIVLGEDIRTSPEAAQVTGDLIRGAGLVSGYSVYCHYQPDEVIVQYVGQLQTPLLAIPETAGVSVQDGVMRVYGTAPVDVLRPARSVSVYPGASYRIG